MNTPSKIGVTISLVMVLNLDPAIAIALTPPEIDRIARAVTVRIDKGEIWGSGILIKREGSTYTVLTANHVVRQRDTYIILTADGRKYPLQYTTVKPFPGVDLAVLKFVSNKNYPIANIGDSTAIRAGSNSYVAGFPKSSAQMGINQVAYQFLAGQIDANAPHPITNGYGIHYTNDTRSGMSGGPVLNDKGELIAVHGLSLTQFVGTRGIDPETGRKVAFNFGIPINTFLNLAPKVDAQLGFRAAILPPPGQAAEDVYVLGLDRFSKGYYQKAGAYFSQAIALNPNYALAYHKRGLVNRIPSTMETIFADTDLSELTKTEIMKKLARSKGVELNFGSGTMAEIAAEFERPAVKAAFSGTDDRSDAASLQKTLSDFNQAIRLNPNFAQAYFDRGEVFNNLQNTQAALADFNRAIRLNPSLEEAYLSRGILLARSNPQDAITDFDRAIQLNPSLIKAYSQRAGVRFMLGNSQGAIGDSQKAADFYQAQGDPFFAQMSSFQIAMFRSIQLPAGGIGTGGVRFGPGSVENFNRSTIQVDPTEINKLFPTIADPSNPSRQQMRTLPEAIKKRMR